MSNIKKLNYLELLKLLRKCAETRHYRGGVFFASQNEAARVYKEALDAVRSDKYEAGVLGKYTTRTTTKSFIEFTNGSIIWFIAMREGIQGMRVHEALYDEHIDSTIVRMVLEPMMMRYEWKVGT